MSAVPECFRAFYPEDMQDVRAMENQETMREGEEFWQREDLKGSPGRKASQSCVPLAQKHMLLGPPWCPVVKTLPCNTEDVGLIPSSGN